MASGDQLSNYMIATRVGTTRLATNSPTTSGTTQSQLTFVQAFLQQGKTYGIRLDTRITASAAVVGTDSVFIRIREDNATGTELVTGHLPSVFSGGAGHTFSLYAEYTATATGLKTFSITGQRNAGSANYTILASSTSPTIIAVDLIPT